MIKEIKSTSNILYKTVKSLKNKKYRTEHSLFTVEGIKSTLDAISAGAPVEYIIVDEDFASSNARLIKKINNNNIIKMPKSLYNTLCDTKTPQGIMGVIKISEKSFSEAEIKKGGFYIYLDHISDPGNAGTIIRTADAAGTLGVLFSPDSADIYSPKTVRSTMGSFFHTPIYTGVKTASLVQLKNDGFTVVAGDLSKNAVLLDSIKLSKDTVLVIGNEANGVSDEVRAICDLFVLIPIYGKAESLNASVAAAILMYETAKSINQTR